MGNRFEVLDSFRGIAAILVALYHFRVNGYITELYFVRNSYLFVEFFFILSGFVISYSSFNKIDSFNDVRLFMSRRFSRIYPLHLFMTIMFIPFALANIYFHVDVGDRFSLFALFTNLTLVQALGVNEIPTWNLPSWSISVEFYTYFLFSILAAVGVLRKSNLFILLLPLVSFIILFNFSSMADSKTFAVFRCTYSFFLGVFVFSIHKRFKSKPSYEFLVIFLLALFMIDPIEPTSYKAFMSPLLFSFVILVFSKEQGSLSLFFKKNIFQKLGVLSFSIYMTHAWVVSMIKAASLVISKLTPYSFMANIDGVRVIDFGFDYLNDLIIVPYVVLVVLISKFTYEYIEVNYQKTLNNYFKRCSTKETSLKRTE